MFRTFRCFRTSVCNNLGFQCSGNLWFQEPLMCLGPDHKDHMNVINSDCSEIQELSKGFLVSACQQSGLCYGTLELKLFFKLISCFQCWLDLNVCNFPEPPIVYLPPPPLLFHLFFLTYSKVKRQPNNLLSCKKTAKSTLSKQINPSR